VWDKRVCYLSTPWSPGILIKAKTHTQDRADRSREETDPWNLENKACEDLDKNWYSYVILSGTSDRALTIAIVFSVRALDLGLGGTSQQSIESTLNIVIVISNFVWNRSDQLGPIAYFASRRDHFDHHLCLGSREVHALVLYMCLLSDQWGYCYLSCCVEAYRHTWSSLPLHPQFTAATSSTTLLRETRAWSSMCCSCSLPSYSMTTASGSSHLAQNYLDNAFLFCPAQLHHQLHCLFPAYFIYFDNCRPHQHLFYHHRSHPYIALR